MAVMTSPSALKKLPKPLAMKRLLKVAESCSTFLTSLYLNRVKVGWPWLAPACVGTPMLFMKSPVATGDVARLSRHTAYRSMSVPR